MKKETYKAPVCEVLEMEMEQPILSGSDQQYPTGTADNIGWG